MGNQGATNVLSLGVGRTSGRPEAGAADALDQEVQTTLVWHETIGTLVKNELLDRELVYDWLWVAGSWERVGPAARAAREKAGVPELFANFEELAQGQS